MNIASAIRSMRDGQAVKPSTWRGYVERIDKPFDEGEYGTDPSYAVGDTVKYNDRRYICTVEVEDSTEAFDYSKWQAIDADRYIVFVDADDTEHPGPTPGATSDNPSAIYLGTVGTSNDNITWSRLTGAIPAAVKVVHPGWPTNCPTPVDMPDYGLFTAVLSDTWEVGSAADYEVQRTGSNGRW